MKRIVEPLLAILLLTASCTSDVIPNFQSQVVVEGWIENGRSPIVRLSSTVPVSTDFSKQEDLLNNTIDNAVVTITCDGQTYLLHHEKNEDYYPSSIYTSDELAGVVGKSYALNIKTAEGAELQATTSIPTSPVVLKTGVTSATEKGKYTGYTVIDDNLSQHRYYKMFVRIGNSHREEYHSSFMGESDNRLFSEVNPKLPIYGYSTSKKDSSHVYFRSGEEVSVKLCCTDSVAYNYWSEYAKMQELSRNPIFTYQHSLPTNIKGGIGYWLGYGSVRFNISML